MAGDKKSTCVAEVKTRSGRVSKPVDKDAQQNCVMGFAAIEKCRAKKKKQLKNVKYYSKKKENKKKGNKVKNVK